MEDATSWEVLLRWISSVPKGFYFSLLPGNTVSIKNYHPEVGLLAFVREIHIIINKVHKSIKGVDVGDLGRKKEL